MPLQIVRNDITKMKVDAIVNAAKSSLLGGGGVDGCIHEAAGSELLEECKALGGCNTGDAKITKGYKLPCKYVIHTVGPVWNGGDSGEKELLTSCYVKSLEIAEKHKLKTVAFPLISSGVYGYPKDKALRVAIDTISEFLMDTDSDMTVYIVIFDKKAYSIGEKLFKSIESFIDDHYVDAHTPVRRRVPRLLKESARLSDEAYFDIDENCRESFSLATPQCTQVPEISLDDALKLIDESFSEMLLRKIDEKNMTESECYKKANVDRKLFSKIRSNKNYKPGKPTVIAFAMALELTLDETREMLMKAGFALSRSSKFDIIVEFFISRGNYNVFELNEALFAFDQMLIGV